MSILAYIALKNKGAETLRGDIFKVVAMGTPIARRTRQVFAFMVVDDPALESRLAQIQAKLDLDLGPGHFASISYPYKSIDGRGVMTKTSTRNANLAALPPDTIADIDNPSRDSPIIALEGTDIRSR